MTLQEKKEKSKKLTKKQKSKKDEIFKALDQKEFKDRYGDSAEQVMHAVATKGAKGKKSKKTDEFINRTEQPINRSESMFDDMVRKQLAEWSGGLKVGAKVSKQDSDEYFGMVKKELAGGKWTVVDPEGKGHTMASGDLKLFAGGKKKKKTRESVVREGEGWDSMAGIAFPKLGYEEGDQVAYVSSPGVLLGTVIDIDQGGGIPEEHQWDSAGNPVNDLDIAEYSGNTAVKVQTPAGDIMTFNYNFEFEHQSNRTVAVFRDRGDDSPRLCEHEPFLYDSRLRKGAVVREGEGWDSMAGIAFPKLGYEEGDRVAYADSPDALLGTVIDIDQGGGIPEEDQYIENPETGEITVVDDLNIMDYSGSTNVKVRTLDGDVLPFTYHFEFKNQGVVSGGQVVRHDTVAVFSNSSDDSPQLVKYEADLYDSRLRKGAVVALRAAPDAILGVVEGVNRTQAKVCLREGLGGTVVIARKLIENFSPKIVKAAAQGKHDAAFRDVDKLIRKKKDVNVQDSDGNTALHMAAKAGNINLVKRLAGAGADKDLKNNDGKTAAQVAKDDATASQIGTKLGKEDGAISTMRGDDKKNRQHQQRKDNRRAKKEKKMKQQQQQSGEKQPSNESIRVGTHVACADQPGTYIGYVESLSEGEATVKLRAKMITESSSVVMNVQAIAPFALNGLINKQETSEDGKFTRGDRVCEASLPDIMLGRVWESADGVTEVMLDYDMAAEHGEPMIRMPTDRLAVYAPESAEAEAKPAEETTAVAEAERPFLCIHPQHGKHECLVAESYDAAKSAAARWKMRTLAGIEVYPLEVRQSGAAEPLNTAGDE